MQNAVPESPPTYSIQSVDNALQLLLMLHRDGSLRLSDAAEELHVARSTAHRLLAMLRFRGFVEQANDRTYVPGPACSDLGGELQLANALAGIARPHLEQLTDCTQETSNMAVRQGAEIKIVDTVECVQSLRIGSRVGVRLPAARTAAGRALLAELPFEEIVDLYPELRDDKVRRDELARSLLATRRQGFAVCVGESERGVAALGMAVRGGDGTTVAAVCMVAPTTRFSPNRVSQMLPVLAKATKAIRSDLLELSVGRRRVPAVAR